MIRMARLFFAGVLLGTALIGAVWGEQSDEAEQVRKLLQKEQEGWVEGDQEQVISCFVSDAVGY